MAGWAELVGIYSLFLFYEFCILVFYIICYMWLSRSILYPAVILKPEFAFILAEVVRLVGKFPPLP